MRLALLLASVTAVALTAAGTADAGIARWTATDTETLELNDGSGLAVVSGRGALFGHIDKGIVRITDLPMGADTTIVVAGDDSSKADGSQTRVYKGVDLTFR